MKRFVKLYLWAVDAKRTMGVFFAVYVLMYLFFGLFCGVTALPNGIAFSMLALGLLVGISQAAILPEDKITLPRAIIWTALCETLTLLFGLTGKWFAGFPIIAPTVFYLFCAGGYVSMWLGLHLRAKKETEELCGGLKHYQGGRA